MNIDLPVDILSNTVLYLEVLGQYKALLIGTCLYFVSMRQTWSELGQKRAALFVTWRYWVSIGQYWLVLGGTGSEQGGPGCQYDMFSEDTWFTWNKASNYCIFKERKSDDGHADGQNFLL